jgi:ribulose-5-phosphate 4-epimerase/fuculose-1-phosphate aldolase
MSVTALRPVRDPEEWQLRVDLAAAFRLAVLNDWHEAVANHFSVATSEDGSRFLMNPRWMHFSRIRASDLLHLDARDPTTMDRADAPDPSAWCIHGRLHALVPHARCILHVHPPYATALAALADPTILPVDQNTARYFRRVAIDLEFGGIADREAEGERIAHALGERRRLMMGNHGILVVAATVAEAFDDLYYLERSCRTLMLAYASGRPLSVLPDDVAEATALAWEGYSPAAAVHFAESKRLLDARGETYAE